MSSKNEHSDSPSKKDLKVFNLIWAGVFLLISLIPLIKGADFKNWPLIVSGTFLVIAMTCPQATKAFYKIWVIFGAFIGAVNSKIILGLLFFAMITPVGLFMRLLGKDILSKKLDAKKSSYWEDRETQPTSMRNQF